jgi:hypothetical protein
MAYKTLVEKLAKIDHLGKVGIYGKIILKWD